MISISFLIACSIVFAGYKEDQASWLTNNSHEEGVQTTDSGLQYIVLKEGDGVHFPSASDKVKVHYEGTLIDGTEFDSSVKRGRPAEFRLNGVIKGWTEGVQLQSIGSKLRFYMLNCCPSTGTLTRKNCELELVRLKGFKG